jgi:predicted nucleotide-binding protein (sugar kinase/HSP70/actin superfamily)
LFYYRFASFWESFFKALGVEVVVSDPTNKKILDDGVKSCVDEACLPIKLFCGHALNLKGRADYILVPRFTSISRNEYICPEFGGLPDMIRHTLKGLPELIDTEVNMRKSARGGLKAAVEIGEILGADKRRTIKAFQLASQAFRRDKFYTEFRDMVLKDENRSHPNPLLGSRKGENRPSKIEDSSQTKSQKGENCPHRKSQKGENCPHRKSQKGENCPQPKSQKSENCPYSKSQKSENCPRHKSSKGENRPLRVGVIGHPYNVYDRYISMDLLRKLVNRGVEARTIETVDEADINRHASGLRKPMFWNYGRMAYGAALHMAESGEVDGFICLTSFGCGIDSFVNDLIERHIRRRYGIPLITMTVDEHSGEAGFNTRLEAFIDMLQWRRQNEDHISASG